MRAYFVRRVVLVGAESTGKTTLAQQLAQRFATNWVPEFGREHWELKIRGLSLDGPPPSWSRDEFVDIAAEQQRRENLLARSANRVLICDTNAFATGTWHERYQGCRDARVDAIGANDIADLYLLAEPDVPFVQDGFRDGERIRHWMHARFLEQLEAGNTPYILINGSFDERFAAAARAIEDLIQGPLTSRGFQ